MNNNERKLKDFEAILEVMSDKQFWLWVSEWFSVDYIMDIVRDWEDETKIQEVKRMKEICKQGVKK